MADLLLAGSETFTGGQDSSRIADQIADGCYAAGINVSNRRAALQPRWGFNRKVLNYPPGGIEDQYRRLKTHKDLFEGGKFQMMAHYTVYGKPHLVVVIGGGIYFINEDTYDVKYVEIADKTRLNGRAPRLNWTAAGKYLVIFDFPAYPVIIEAFTARRADPALYEVPPSVMGIFNQNRLFIVNSGNEFTGGDPVGNVAAPEAPITFKEVEQPAATYYGQIFQLPTFDANDTVTSIQFIQLADTSTGIGPLLISTDKAVYSFRTDQPRANWTQGQFGSVFTYNAGIVGPRAAVNVNSDVFFMSYDGYIRTLNMSRQDQQTFSKMPISKEVENWLIVRDRSLLRYTFGGYFNNKVFFAANPYRTEAVDFSTGKPISDYAMGGFVVLEFIDSVNVYGSKVAQPSWAGLWTGLHPMDMVTTNTSRCFIMSKEDGVNILWEIDTTKTYDTYQDKIRYVKAKVYMKEHDFKDPFMNKEVHSIDFNFDNLQGPFEIDIKYKPAHSPYYIDWRKYTHEAPWRVCSVPDPILMNGLEGHHIRDFTVGTPTDSEACSLVTNDYTRVFRKLQLQVTVTGKYWEIHEYRIKAVLRPKREVESLCDNLPAVQQPSICNTDWSVEEFC